MMYVIKMSNRTNDERVEMKITAEDVFFAIDIARSRVENPEEMELIEASPALGNVTKMTVREFLAILGDVTITDDATSELYTELCAIRPNLTEEGEREFSEVLDYEVLVPDDEELPAFLHISNDEDWSDKLWNAKDFFYCYTGHCPAEDWNKWFYYDYEPEGSETDVTIIGPTF